MVPADPVARGQDRPLGGRVTPEPAATMPPLSMDLFDDLRWRGLAYQWTGEDALPARLAKGPITLYDGFDPTADSLQVGNLVGIMMLRRFQRAGHRPIVVMGGATGMIGDPTGKSEERNLLTPEQIQKNLESQRPQFERFLDFGSGDALMVNNADWFARIGFMEFLRDIGKHAPVNVMLAKESVRARLESPTGISYTEFSYMLMQAYDFLHLYRAEGCELQIGGSDQFGNITAGVDLARRLEGVQLFGLTSELVTDNEGQKLGKTAAGTVWLSPERTSPYAFYQYWLRVPDADAGRYLRMLTDLPHDSVEELEAQLEKEPQKRAAQRALAREITLLVHGEDGLGAAERATDALFGGDLDGLSEGELLEIFADVPSKELPRARLGQITAADALVETGLAKSKSDARRVIEEGGASVGNRTIGSTDDVLTGSDLASETVMVLRRGKRSFGLLRFPSG
jgi:tyrosyl-tRNA synthetase